MESIDISELNTKQILILLAIKHLSIIQKKKEYPTSQIRGICKKFFYHDMTNTRFNNCIRPERKGLLRYGLVIQKGDEKADKFYSLDMRKVNKCFFSNISSKVTKSRRRMLKRMIEIAAHIAFNMKHSRDKDINKLSKEERTNISNRIAKEIKIALVEYMKTGLFQPHVQFDKYPIKITRHVIKGH